MRGRSRHRQVRAEMALRHQEDHPKEQCRQTDTPCFATHVPDKTKLRTDWLQGQAPCPSARTDAYPHFNVIRDGRSDHGTVATHLGRRDTVILELSLVGFLSPLARKFDTYPLGSDAWVGLRRTRIPYSPRA